MAITDIISEEEIRAPNMEVARGGPEDFMTDDEMDPYQDPEFQQILESLPTKQAEVLMQLIKEFKAMVAQGFTGEFEDFVKMKMSTAQGGPEDFPTEDEMQIGSEELQSLIPMGQQVAQGGRIGFDKGTSNKSKIAKLAEKFSENLKYTASEFFFNDPSLFLSDKDRKQYDALSPDKQDYIDAFLINTRSGMTEEKDWLFKKPGKIRFPITEKMKEHNRKYFESRFEDADARGYKAQGGRVGLQGGTPAIDPRMKQSLRENTALNDARRAVNEALSGTGGEGAIDRLYERFHVGNPRMFSPGTNPRPGQTYHSISDRAALERELSGKILGGGYKGTAEYERQQQAARDRIAAKEQAKAEAEAKRIEAAIKGAYGKPEDYEFQAQLLGMNPQAYYDYLATGNPKGVDMGAGITSDAYSRSINPYNVYFAEQQARDVQAGLPTSQQIQYGQVMRPGGIPMIQPGQTP